MADENCGNCAKFYAIKVASGKGTSRESNHGHCLYKCIYAKNKPGNPVYPPGAKVEDREYGQHHIVVVRRKQVLPNCPGFSKKGERK